MSVTGNVPATAEPRTMLGIQVMNRTSQTISAGSQIIVIGSATPMIVFNTDPYGSWDMVSYRYTCGRSAYYRITYKVNVVILGSNALAFYVSDGTNSHLLQTVTGTLAAPATSNYCFSGSEVIYLTSGTTLQFMYDAAAGGGLITTSSPTQDGTILEIIYEGD